MKYDIRAPKRSRVPERIRTLAEGRPIFVAGSTVDGNPAEEELVIRAWKATLRGDRKALLVLAPRHPERFATVETMLRSMRYVKVSEHLGVEAGDGISELGIDVVLVDTIGDLAAVYGVADAAFVGGSLVSKGGHNPLEPAQFGVPVVMGGSFENFRDVVTKLQEAGGIRIVKDEVELGGVVADLLEDRAEAKAIGDAGQRVFDEQQGATERSVKAIVSLIQGDAA
jgi:3-deoxy-D-manno-octulosonic-acid transferase